MQEDQIHHERPSRSRGAFQVIFLFLLLVVAPLGSWLYLRSGLAYRKDHLKALTDGSAIPAAIWKTNDGVTISTSNWTEQVSLILFADDSLELKAQIDQLALVLSQFDDREDVLFYQITDQQPVNQAYYPADTAQWKILTTMSVKADPFWSYCQASFPSDSKDKIYLIDRRANLRQAFPIATKADLTQLVEVVAILLPPRKLNHPELNRTKER